jgi:hypothetical protein
VFVLWMRLVRQFSLRSLAYSSDILPAIFGLAAMMAAKTKSKYMAGREKTTFIASHGSKTTQITLCVTSLTTLPKSTTWLLVGHG